MFWVGSIFSSCEYPTLSMDQFILVEWDNFFAIGSFYRYILRGIRTGGWVAVALWEVVGCVNKDLSHEKKVHGRLIDNCILWCCGVWLGDEEDVIVYTTVEDGGMGNMFGEW